LNESSAELTLRPTLRVTENRLTDNRVTNDLQKTY
jgi:hypothetical protein